MTSKTHKVYSVSFALIVGMVMYKNNITVVNYYLSLLILLLISKQGALFPDVDHIWKNVKEKTTVNWIINKLIHITGGKHRSWQTHSIDIWAIFGFITCFLPNYLYNKGVIDIVNKEVLSLVLIGFISGWGSHLFSDMLTPEGVRLVCWNNFKLKFVPRAVGRLKFNTGGSWEEFNYKTMRIINIIIGVISILLPFIPNITILITPNM